LRSCIGQLLHWLSKDPAFIRIGINLLIHIVFRFDT
jgi:hypothetical protein